MKKVFTLFLLTSFALGVFAQKRNMIANSRFEEGYLNWFAEGSSLDTLGDIKYDIDSITPISGKKSAKITIKRNASNFWDRSFGYVVPITAGCNYQIRVKVRATGTTKLNIEFGQNHGPWDYAYAKGDKVIGTTVTEIVINTNGNAVGTATTKSDFNFVFKFDLGDQPNGAVIWIDDISLTQLSGNWDGNLVPLGDFEEVSAGWNSYFDMWGIGTCANLSIDNNNMINGKSLHITKTSTNADWKATDLEFFYKQNKLADYEISFDILAANGSVLGAQLFKSYMSNMSGTHEEAACLLSKTVTSTQTNQVQHFVINKNNTDSSTYRQRGLNSAWGGIVKVYSGFGTDVMPVGYDAYLDNIKVKEVITLKSLEIAGDSIITRDTTLRLWAVPTHADNSSVWGITNGTGTATIDIDGKLHPLSNGTVTVTAVSKIDGSIAASKIFSVVLPVVQSSGISFSDVKRSSLRVSFTAGNGSKRAIFVAAGTTGSPTPVNNTEYAVGEQIGTTGWYCKYVGNSNTAIITGLSPSTTYRVKVSDYAVYPSLVLYTLTDTLLNPDNVTTTSSYLSQTITFDSISIKGQLDADFDPLAVASSGLAVTYTSSNSSVATIVDGKVHIVGIGTSIITASQSGNDDYSSANPVQRVLFVKDKFHQTITFGALASKLIGDAPFKLTATANSGLTVSYKSSDASVAKISNDTVIIVSVGTTIISAYQPGDADNYPADTVKQSFTVTKLQQTITFGALDSKPIGSAPLKLTATASSGLTVSYKSSNTSVAKISNDTVIIIGAGTTTIAAYQPGNSDYYPADTVKQSFTVSKLQQTITFGTLVPKVYGDAPATLSAQSSASLTIGFASSNSSVATINGNILTIKGAGTTTITASQAGNDTYDAASNVTQVLTVTKATLNVSVRDTSRVRGAGNNPTFIIVYNGFVYSDNHLVLDVEPTATCAADANSPVGEYPIIISGGQSGNYDFIYSTTGKLTVTSGTAIAGLSILPKVYPNPVTNTLFVGGDGIRDISIFSIGGSMMQKLTISGNIVDMSQLPSGIYMVKVSTDSGSFVETVVKQ